jgi:hypothetical protein
MRTLGGFATMARGSIFQRAANPFENWRKKFGYALFRNSSTPSY